MIRLLVFLLLLPWGDQASADAFFDRAMQRLASLSGFQCRFEQKMLFSDGGSQQYAGELAVRRPGRFRWQYLQPYEQLYVSDGSLIWHYEPDLMQAEKLGDLEAVDPVVMRLLDGRLSASDIRVVESAAGDERRRYRIALGDAQPVWLVFDASGDLEMIERRDVLGNINRMRFADCAYIAPSENLFSFSPPAGVEVLDMRAQP